MEATSGVRSESLENSEAVRDKQSECISFPGDRISKIGLNWWILLELVSIELERFPSRQDLAVKTQIHLAVIDEDDETRDSFLLQSLCMAYDQGYGYGLRDEDVKCPYPEGTQNQWCWQHGFDKGTESRESFHELREEDIEELEKVAEFVDDLDIIVPKKSIH